MPDVMYEYGYGYELDGGTSLLRPRESIKVMMQDIYTIIQ